MLFGKYYTDFSADQYPKIVWQLPINITALITGEKFFNIFLTKKIWNIIVLHISLYPKLK